MILSAHFTAAELGVTPATPPEHVEALTVLCETLLEPLRAHYLRPVVVTSGWRSAAKNAALPGASATSQHLRGEAADLHVPGVPCWEVWRWLAWDSGLRFGQVILESGKGGRPWTWVHLSLGAPYRSPERCGQVLTRTGATTYRRWTDAPGWEP